MPLSLMLMVGSSEMLEQLTMYSPTGFGMRLHRLSSSRRTHSSELFCGRMVFTVPIMYL